MSRQVAVIAPTSLLDWLQSQFQLTFHLVLTKRCLEDVAYMAFYRKRRLEGDFLILDNSAAEVKAAIEGSSMMDVAKELCPSIVVAPDVIYNKNETLKRTEGFLKKYWFDLKDLDIKVMAVPQGGSSEEWYDCYQKFNSDPHIDWLGISMFYTPKFNQRLEVLKLIASTVHKPCHLLGLWDNPYDLLGERKFDFVKSVDTAKPIEFALEGLTLADWARHKHIDDDWYFNTAGKDLGPAASEVLELITKNVRDYVRLFEEGL